MSGYNNFSYFNVPTTTNEWWTNNDPKISTFEMNKQAIASQWAKPVSFSDFNQQPVAQNIVQNYTQNLLQPIDSRSIELAQPRHELLHGTVTQLFSNFGYINDNIIFSKSDVMGQMVTIGDKVAVDATFQPNNPTKYKGERVCKIDDSRVNPVTNTGFGKINTSVMQPTTPQRFETPVTNRWDMNKPSQPMVRPLMTMQTAPVQSVSTKPATEQKKIYQVQSSSSSSSLSARTETSNKSLVDSGYSNKTSPIKINIPTKKSKIAARLGAPVTAAPDATVTAKNKTTAATNDNASMSPRIDLTVRSRSSSHNDSPVKNRSEKKSNGRTSSPRSDKTRSDDKISSSRRSDDGRGSHKHSPQRRHSRSKDKSSSYKDKSRDNEPKSKNSTTKNQQYRNLEALKRKAISPIRFEKSPKSTPSSSSSAKKSSETKTIANVVTKSYENFAHRELDCAAVKNLFRTLSVPKEFFHIALKYQQSFPLNHPMKLGYSCHFKIMDKKIKSIDSHIDVQLRKEIDPKDADTTFIAKVILLSTDDLAKFYKDTLTLAEEFDGDNKLPITKAIKFLVASVGADKEFAIGGAWSPSLDGPDPDNNPRVLINTAIRTCKAMTGIDLSNCSSWSKFLELHYYRPLHKKQGSDESVGNVVDEPIEYVEPSMVTVVYYIPDVWNCVPSMDTWKDITRLYKEQLTCILCPPPVSIRPVGSATTGNTSTSDTAQGSMSGGTSDGGDQEEEDWSGIEDKDPNTDSAIVAAEEQPTHFSKLVISGMKIVDIKRELELRKLSNRGVMEQLKARLKTALDREEVEEKNKETPAVTEPVSTTTEAPKSSLTDEQKAELKKQYTLPDLPEIIVHQNRKIFGNQMKIKIMSLHSLLSYHDATLQESTFELAIFAKQFLEMLRRDAVFNIYKSIVVADEADLTNKDEPAKKAKLMVTTSKRTIHRPLLFSCTLLDKERTNKIYLDDLRALIEGLGICLSTNQLSSVLDKVKGSSKYFHYRQLTDKEMTDSEISDMLSSDVSEDLDYIKELAMGNKALFESDSIPMDISMNDDELDRLRNELDRSERYRQSVDLKVSEMRQETKKAMTKVERQAKEILRLKEQLSDYKNRYRDEQERGTSFRSNYDRLLRQVRDIDIMAAGLNKCVSETVAKHEALGAKKCDPKESRLSTKKTRPDKTTTNRSKDDATKMTVDLTTSAVTEDCCSSMDLDTVDVEINEPEHNIEIAKDIEDDPVSDGEEEPMMITDVDGDVTGDVADDVLVTNDDVDVTVDDKEVTKDVDDGADQEAEVEAVVNSGDVVGPIDGRSNAVDEFELSKECDYDMISVEDTDL